jgi:hypothetical protein
VKRLLLLALLFLGTGYVGYDMWQLSEQDLLWGHRPLFFIIGCWAVIVLLRSIITEKRGHVYNWRLSGYSTLAGALLAISFPGLLPIPLFMFVGLVPLLFVEEECSTTMEKRSGMESFQICLQCLSGLQYSDHLVGFQCGFASGDLRQPGKCCTDEYCFLAFLHIQKGCTQVRICGPCGLLGLF